MKYKSSTFLFTTLCLSVSMTHAQTEKENKKWDVTKVPQEAKEITFTTKEGTWMNLDVSPDGKEIVFDMLGDIYSMPIAGGKAKLLKGGLAWECQPRFSPNGQYISFTSDAEGGDNIWKMNRDGSNAHAITKEDFRLLNNAVWMPDNQYIVAKKHFTSRRSLGAGEMWMYHISGGKGLQVTTRKNDQMDVGEPCVSPDGRYIYFSEDMSPGNHFSYNKDANKQIYIIRRVDRQTGEVENMVTGGGGAVRPQLSPDGNLLAFVKRVRLQSVLFLHNLATGEEWPIYDGLDKDQQETWATFGVYPNYAWTPDGKYIVFWAKGEIWKIDILSLETVNIPFEAEVKQFITDAVQFPQQVAPATFEAKMIRHAITSPDEKMLVFNAVGLLWIKELPDGTPKRLTSDTHFEMEPSFSPDGKFLVYTTWNDEEKGSIYRFSLKEKKTEKLTKEKGYYFTPSFSPDGSKIVFRKKTGNTILGFTYGENPGIYWIPSSGGTATLIIKEGENPVFEKSGKRIFYQSYDGENKVYKSINLNGSDEQTHFSGKYFIQIVPSPDNKWMAFTELFQAYIAPFPQTGKTIDLSGKTDAFPVYKITTDAGINLHWSSDSKKLHWSIGPEYFTRSIQESFTFVEDAPDSIRPPDTTGIQIGLALPTDVPDGKIALKGARIITMKGDEVIEDGCIIIEKNHIVSIGKEEEVNIPADAKIIDVKGKTIIPGMVDVHAHPGYSDIIPQQSWPFYAQLAYGVTTMHDPSAPTELVFSQSEMLKAGIMVGPRTYSTGTILYGAEGDFKAVINSLDDARSNLRRMKAVGAFSVKSYNQPRREQRQQVIQAARELNMMVYPEGGSFFYHNMTMMLDGHTGVEHSIPVAPLYNDVIQLWGKSKTGYTPTLIVGYGGIWGENYWFQKTNVWENKRLLTYTPRTLVDERSRRRMMIPDDDFGHIKNSESCKKLADNGVKIQLGAHGQLNGLGAHWELWMFVQGGMSNMEALRAATLWGAEYIGMDKEIGSLETGKLADLVVLDKNPLENIQNSNSVKYVMLNGRLYDAVTMNETGNYNKKRNKFFWEYSNYSQSFEWHYDTQSFDIHKCSCFGVH